MILLLVVVDMSVLLGLDMALPLSVASVAPILGQASDFMMIVRCGAQRERERRTIALHVDAPLMNAFQRVAVAFEFSLE